MSVNRLEGKVAVVTGGNSGIGLASAKRLKDEGARVAISGRDRKTLDEAVKLLGKDVLAVQADVSKLADTDRFFAEVSKKFGKIDVLFVNAGIAKFALPEAVTEDHFDEIFDIDAKGAYFTVQKALPYLNDNASIILNTSVAGQKGLANASVYSATKAALRSLARTFADLCGSQHTRQRRGTGADRNADLRPDRSFERSDRRFRKKHCLHGSHAAFGKAGGGGRSRRVPSFCRRFVRYRRGNQRGWWDGADLSL